MKPEEFLPFRGTFGFVTPGFSKVETSQGQGSHGAIHIGRQRDDVVDTAHEVGVDRCDPVMKSGNRGRHGQTVDRLGHAVYTHAYDPALSGGAAHTNHRRPDTCLPVDDIESCAGPCSRLISNIDPE